MVQVRQTTTTAAAGGESHIDSSFQPSSLPQPNSERPADVGTSNDRGAAAAQILNNMGPQRGRAVDASARAYGAAVVSNVDDDTAVAELAAADTVGDVEERSHESADGMNLHTLLFNLASHVIRK